MTKTSKSLTFCYFIMIARLHMNTNLVYFSFNASNFYDFFKLSNF